LVWLLWPAAHSRGDGNPSGLSQLDGFMKQWRLTPFGSEATQAKRWLKCANQDPMGDSRPIAFLGYPEGHRIDPETRGCSAARGAPNERIDTLPRTRASQEPMGHHRGMKPWEITWVLLDAQAACVFSCCASKRSPLFQSVKVMAAILRARVRRAISGFMPLASKVV
jgi:hypothetical protein